MPRPATLAEALDARLTGQNRQRDAARLARNNAHNWPGIAELDAAARRAHTDPGWLASMPPHQQAVIRQRMANLDHREQGEPQ